MSLRPEHGLAPARWLCSHFSTLSLVLLSCSFAHGNLATVGQKYHALIDTQQEPYCPVPAAVAKVLAVHTCSVIAASASARRKTVRSLLQRFSA